MMFPHIDKLNARGHWGIKLGLENPRLLLKALGNPEASFPSVLIAGTNGKGSTGAFMSSALRASGWKVGWTTSPHLVSPAERIWVDGHICQESELDGTLAAVFAAEEAAGIQATYFELMIAAALLVFQKTKVDLALVEVGMGGRFDATNVLDPMLTVLTNVALDHTQYLGETREAIGQQKLYTARTDRPLVLGPDLDLEWVKPLLVNQPVLYPAKPLHADHVAWDHSMVEGKRVGLAGAHQLSNLATAFEALACLKNLGFPSERAFEGIATCQWPGRLWVVPTLSNVWVDGAHNPDGAKVLASHARACKVHPHLFFAVMADKNSAEMAQWLRSMEPASITLVEGSQDRYAKTESLQAVWGSNTRTLSLREAALELHEPSQDIRLVTGSLYFIGDLLREWRLESFLSEWNSDTSCA